MSIVGQMSRLDLTEVEITAVLNKLDDAPFDEAAYWRAREKMSDALPYPGYVKSPPWPRSGRG